MVSAVDTEVEEIMTNLEYLCEGILKELKSGRRYTRYELEFLHKYFNEIAKVTKKMLDKIDE